MCNSLVSLPATSPSSECEPWAEMQKVLEMRDTAPKSG